MAAIHLGTSGYVYKHWKGLLYPPKLQASRWLPRYAQVFTTVELNATFYRLPTPDAVDCWRDAVPPGFLFACKGSRFLTHMKKLTDVGEGLERYYTPVLRLGRKLGPVLWQLPPHMTKPDPGKLDRFLAAQPRGVQQVIEFRHPAWYHPEVLEVLRRHRASLCEHDLVEAPLPAPKPTASFRYIRFHGHGSRYAGRYGREALRPFARDLKAWRARGHTAWVYFNNDLHGHALLDAFDLAELLDVPVHVPPEMDRPPAGLEPGTA